MVRTRKSATAVTAIASKKSFTVQSHPDEAAVDCWVDNSNLDSKDQASVKVVINAPFLDGTPTVLHWGRTSGPNAGWSQPNDLVPPDSIPFGDQMAAQTPFHKHQANQCHLQFAPPGAPDAKLPLPPTGIAFVIKQGNASWWKSSTGDFVYNLAGDATDTHGSSVDTEALANRFVDPEASFTNYSQFSRFILCVEVLKNPVLDFETAAWLTTILRLASLRMLDWFRNYNYQARPHCDIQFVVVYVPRNANAKTRNQMLTFGEFS